MTRGNTKKKNPKRFNSKMQANLLLVFCVVIVLFLLLIARIYYVIKNDGERYEKRVLSQQTYVSNPILYQRGSIVDRNDTVLAKSEKIYNLVFDPAFILSEESYREPTLNAVTSCFDMEGEEFSSILEEKAQSRYVVVKENVPYEQVEQFRELKNADKKNLINGIRFEESFQRVYPLKTVASDVVGFTNSKGKEGLGGIEDYYNDELSGSNGREYGYFDADLNLERTVKPAVNGNTIVSTIDANVQSIVEKQIAKFNKEKGSKNTAAIVMSIKTGEIYAMASGEPFDLNNPWDLSPFYKESEIKKMTEEEKQDALNKIWRNFCISDAFEPGSTFKPITVAAALEEAAVTQKTSFVCNGKLNVAGVNIACTSSHQNITLSQSLMKSCNSAMMQIAAKLGRANFSKYQQIFGIGSKTGIDLPGEAYGSFYGEEGLNPVELATSSFGQSLTTNMLQIASAVSSIVNGGHYYQPHVVKAIRNENRAIVKTIEPILVRDTVSAETGEFIRESLFKTIEEGTGKAVKIQGYEIGGKTGTAEKIGRDKKNYVISFIGFAPAADPEVLVYVVIDEPKVEEQSKCAYAKELSRDIMKEILPFLNIFPTGETESEPGTAEEPEVNQGENAPGSTQEPEGSIEPESTQAPEEDPWNTE